VEYTQRVEKDAQGGQGQEASVRAVLIIVSTTAAEASSYHAASDSKKAMGTFAKLGARYVGRNDDHEELRQPAQRTGNVGGGTSASDDVQDLNNGRQALHRHSADQADTGKYEALAQPSALQTILPEWGKMIATIHNMQLNQYKVTIASVPTRDRTS
jgi:hypothetical protein